MTRARPRRSAVAATSTRPLLHYLGNPWCNAVCQEGGLLGQILGLLTLGCPPGPGHSKRSFTQTAGWGDGESAGGRAEALAQTTSGFAVAEGRRGPARVPGYGEPRARRRESTKNLTGSSRPLRKRQVLLGDMGAGKSSLVLRFVKGQFFDYQESTIGAAFLTQTVAVNDATVKFEIWDTAGGAGLPQEPPAPAPHASLPSAVFPQSAVLRQLRGVTRPLSRACSPPFSVVSLLIRPLPHGIELVPEASSSHIDCGCGRHPGVRAGAVPLTGTHVLPRRRGGHHRLRHPEHGASLGQSPFASLHLDSQRSTPQSPRVGESEQSTAPWTSDKETELVERACLGIVRTSMLHVALV